VSGTIEAQTEGPVVGRRSTGDGGPGEAEIPEARTVFDRCARDGGPPGRSRMNEVVAA
jgi:hypothetical protein